MKQPTEPSKEDCCNSGCNPCIFDVYEQQLKKYKKFLETGEVSNIHTENALSQLEYNRFVLVKKVDICKQHKLLFFKQLSKVEGRKVWWEAGDHFLLKYHTETVSCTRAYTPLKIKEQKEEFDFAIIVKLYENGLVTNYLNKLNTGDETLWRGPYGSFKVTPNKFKRIILIAQGTGITPFISIIEKILNNEDDFTKIVLFYCAKEKDVILLRDELYSYRQYWNYSYKIFLSRASEDIVYKYQEPIIQHKLGQEDINSLKPVSPEDQFLLCGSSDFMKHFEKLLISVNSSLKNIILF